MKRVTLFIIAAFILCPAFASQGSRPYQIDPVKVRRELKQILSSPEYRPVQSGPLSKMIQSVGKAVSSLLGRAAKWLLNGLALDQKSGILDILGAWAVALGFVALLILVARRLVIAANNVTEAGRLSEPPADQTPTSRDLMYQAAKLAESGDYRSAFRAAYLASIAYLDDLRLLRFERSRTNWEYLRELSAGGHKEAYGQLRPITVDFDRKIYGGESCGQEDYINAVRIFDTLSEAIR